MSNGSGGQCVARPQDAWGLAISHGSGRECRLWPSLIGIGSD